MVHTRKLILGLPKCNRDLLIAILKFLNLVAEHEPVNKMSSLNLAVVRKIKTKINIRKGEIKSK